MENIAPECYNGSMTGERFEKWFEFNLLKSVKAGCTIIMDRESFHRKNFHYVGYPVALIVSMPPVVWYLPAYPSKIVYQLFKQFPAHTPILAWFLIL
jgi:hypothetical protein